MRFILGLFVVLLLVIILDYTDSFLTRWVRNRMSEINNRSLRSFAYKPLNRLIILIMSLLFWLPPIYLLDKKLFLEYKIIITITYWVGLSFALAFYIRKKSSRKTTREALPFIIFFSVAGGMILGPLLAAVKALLFY